MIRGMFGKKKPSWEQDWTIEEMPTGSGAGIPDMASTQQPKKVGFFGQGGVGRGIAGSIGDVLLQYNGAAPIYAPAMQQQRQQKFAEAQYERKRTDDFADAMAMQKYKTENPAQTATQRDVEWIMSLPEDQRKEAFRVMQAKQPTFFNGWDGGRYQNGGEEVLGTELPEGYSIQGGPASAPGNFPQADY